MNEEQKETSAKVVKNASKAFGYTYTSLADLAKAGINIPKMRVKPTEQGEYIEYWDGSEWQLGAKIVVPQMKGSNEAQTYGSALTYARRYTVMLAESVACDDDSKLEKQAPAKAPAAQGQIVDNGFHLDFDTVRTYLKTLKTVGEVDHYYAKLMTHRFTDKQKEWIRKTVGERKAQLEEQA